MANDNSRQEEAVSAPDALDLLMDDHKMVSKLFEKFDDIKDEDDLERKMELLIRND